MSTVCVYVAIYVCVWPDVLVKHNMCSNRNTLFPLFGVGFLNVRPFTLCLAGEIIFNRVQTMYAKVWLQIGGLNSK